MADYTPAETRERAEETVGSVCQFATLVGSSLDTIAELAECMLSGEAAFDAVRDCSIEDRQAAIVEFLERVEVQANGLSSKSTIVRVAEEPRLLDGIATVADLLLGGEPLNSHNRVWTDQAAAHLARLDAAAAILDRAADVYHRLAGGLRTVDRLCREASGRGVNWGGLQPDAVDASADVMGLNAITLRRFAAGLWARTGSGNKGGVANAG